MVNICFLINSREYYIKFIEYIKDLKNITCYFLFKDKDYFNFTDLKILNSLTEAIEECDIIFSLGYWKVIKREEIDIFKKKGGIIINIHYSYLLKYEGRHTCTWAIQNKEKYHGVTFHHITEKLDDGPIIYSEKILIDEHDTSYTLMEKCNNLSFNMLKENFYNIINKKYKIILKKDINSINYSYKDINHEISNEFFINPEELYDKIRSLTYVGKKMPYFVLNGKKIFLKLE